MSIFRMRRQKFHFRIIYVAALILIVCFDLLGRVASSDDFEDPQAEDKATTATTATGTDTPAATGTDTAAATGTDTPAATGTDTPAATGTDTPAATGTDTPAATGTGTADAGTDTGTDPTVDATDPTVDATDAGTDPTVDATDAGTDATDAGTEEEEDTGADEEAAAPANPAAVQLLTQMLFVQFKNMSTFFGPEIRSKLDFCIKDVDAEWNYAFNFSSDPQFMSNCISKTKGDVMQRICTAAEVKFYFSSFLDSGSNKNFLKPNKNCNLSAYVSGCEPGWACSVGKNKKVDLKNSKDVPFRSLACKPCCEGFFCPHGITCMIPCPLGSYCPIATLNKSSGVCDPYHYQLPQGQPNHTCGGADMWADIMSRREVFCSAGSYCPTTIKKVPCSRGHYCRTGSTTQTNCFHLATCEEKTENQNITAYGILIFVGLVLLMLIIYNCSDQVMSTREKKKEQSREAAARSAKETVQAREHWKSAKDVAKKGAIGLQSQLSRTFSKKKSMKSQEFRGTGQAKPGSDAALAAMPASHQAKGSDLTKMIHEIDEDPGNPDGFHVEIGDKHMKKAPKGKDLHTRSSIFRYAYGQIEKEKALQEQNMNLSFSGIISLAADNEDRKRPTIEVDFKDLTLTLKGTNRHLMRCVTGKIMPGRVSAVMGPSGAGKTTFLSALAGKATGCTRSGQILINGKADSIHSYKKIIGFVPQDDIVHGNLSVEENLWFSARCRLPADLPKMEKVLVVERVIESLGLQSVRDSMVGTVEKRGISGGQRKRVNVGLEMVMEPSLLILDEPTSGLDSSSSQLLLRALRREAMEGVNISMVVHQPSYTLFQMFDDLILLAKGGLTAYHGSVKKVEEYFAGIGITVPDRINPPDHFIDILEGVVKPSAASGINFKELPLRWMLHNGYSVPPDMLNTSGTQASGEDSAHGMSLATATVEEHSFVGDILKELKFHLELKKDYILHNFLRSTDLSNRTTPSVFEQYRYFIGRLAKQRMREVRIQAVDFLILLLAGICLGTLAKVSDETFGATGYTYTVIAVSLLTGISALRSFNLDKLHYWRESAAGISSLAYFMAKDAVDLPNTILKPLVYLSMFYFFNNPRSSFLDNYIVCVCLVYCVTGIAYAFAIYLQPGTAQLCSVLVPVVLTLIANQTDPGDFLKRLQDICYTKWALEAFVVANVEKYSGVWLVTRCGSLMSSNYKLDDWVPCLIYLIIAGIVARAVAFFCLVTFQKK